MSNAASHVIEAQAKHIRFLQDEIRTLRVANLGKGAPTAPPSLDALQQREEEIGALILGNAMLGPWMSAAMSDPAVCPEMKATIALWFDAWPESHLDPACFLECVRLSPQGNPMTIHADGCPNADEGQPARPGTGVRSSVR